MYSYKQWEAETERKVFYSLAHSLNDRKGQS